MTFAKRITMPTAALLLSVLLRAVAPPAAAQSVLGALPAGQPTYEIKSSHANLLTLAAQGPGTVTSLDVFNTGRGVYCTYNQASHTGTPTGANLAVLGEDASGNVIQLAVTTNTGTTDQLNGVIVYPGASGTLANFVLASLPVPQRYRVRFIEAGSGSTVTGAVSCTDLP